MDDKLLTRIGNLLRQAEGTDNEHEAATFTQAAQRLATTNSIDLELARARAADRDKPRTPITRMIHIGEPGKKGLRNYVELFVAIARPNDVIVDIAQSSTYVVAHGFADDIDVVEALYVSLVVQMVSASDSYLSCGEWRSHQVIRMQTMNDPPFGRRKVPVAKPMTKLVARLQFQGAFAERIGDRLEAARRDALDAAIRADSNDDGDASSTALVMRNKEVEVNDFYKQASTARGTWRGGRQTAHSDHARSAGHSAAERAALGANNAAALGGASRALAR